MPVPRYTSLLRTARRLGIRFGGQGPVGGFYNVGQFPRYRLGFHASQSEQGP